MDMENVVRSICGASTFLLAATISVQAQYTFTTLPAINGNYPVAYGISGSNVVGWVHVPSDNGSQGFIYNMKSGTYTIFSVPGASQTFPGGISGDKIAGYCQLESTPFGTTENYGFVYVVDVNTFIVFSMGPNTQAFGISGDNVVGSAGEWPNSQGFVYNIVSNTYTLLTVPGAEATIPYGISGTNIVGEYYTGESYPEGFLYNGSTYATLNGPGLYSATADGMSGNTIVGYYQTSSSEDGFVYNGSTYTVLNVPGAEDTYPESVDGNNIAGLYQGGGGEYGFIAIPLTVTLQAAAIDKQFQLTVSSPADPTIVQVSTNLVNWANLFTNTPPFTYTDSAMTTVPRRFYRAMVSQ